MVEKKVLIFDMYETLVINTTELWTPTFNSIVNELGLHVSGKSLWDLWKPLEVTFREERYGPDYPFKSYRQAWTECFEKVFNDMEDVKEGASDYAAEMCVEGWSTRDAYPESKKVLDVLKEHGFLIVLLSNADIDSIENLIKLHKFDFDFVACSEKIQSYKPEETAYNYVLQNMETSQNVLALWDIFSILKGYKTRLVLYTYDSFLFDFDEEEVSVLDKIRDVFKKYNLNIF